MADIVLYDGVCGLCNGLNRFILERDPGARFQFASLQSPYARELLARHGKDARDLDTFYVLVDAHAPGERLLARAEAVTHVLGELGAGWALVARLLGTLPAPVRDRGYGLIARNRYRLFGRYDTCLLPSPENRQRFIAV